MHRFLLTQGTVGLVGEACKRLGGLGASTLRHDGLGWRALCRRASAGPGSVQHDTQPQEAQDRQLVEKKVWNHGTTPSLGGETGSLYMILGPMELSAASRYTTRSTSKLRSGQNRPKSWRRHRVHDRPTPAGTLRLAPASASHLHRHRPSWPRPRPRF